LITNYGFIPEFRQQNGTNAYPELQVDVALSLPKSIFSKSNLGFVRNLTSVSSSLHACGVKRDLGIVNKNIRCPSASPRLNESTILFLGI
jgi:hypothetical protein